MGRHFQQDQRGIGQVLIIAVVVIVIAGIGVTAWKLSSKPAKKITVSTTSSSKTATPSSTPADASCLSAYHDTNLCKFAANSTAFEKTAYTATITTEQSGKSGTLTLENDGNGNTKLTGTESGEELSSITLDGTTYVQTSSSSTWIQYPSGSTTPVTNPTSNMNIGVGSSGITYKALGTTACGNLTCYKYQVADSATPSATQYAFFDTGSYKLREWQYSDAGNSAIMNISYGAVSITKPSPVESLSSLSE